MYSLGGFCGCCGEMGRRKNSSWEVTEMLRGKVALSRGAALNSVTPTP